MVLALDHAHNLLHPRRIVQETETLTSTQKSLHHTEGDKPAAIWAAFDFDGTLTHHDTLGPFLRQLIPAARLAAMLALETPCLAAYALRLISNERAKVRILRRTLGGMLQQQLEDQGRCFAKTKLPYLLNQAMLQRLYQHLKLGHCCVLVTASLTLYTRPWAMDAGFSFVIGSELEFDRTDRATGQLIGGNCYGPEKERRLRKLFPKGSLLYAYGDSRGDREMLSMADFGWQLNAANGFGRNLPKI